LECLIEILITLVYTGMIVLTLFKICPKSKVFRLVFIEVDLKVMNFLTSNNSEQFHN
jgi:hypothetical protein